ncbi:MAG TPA: hypothetical protein VKB80_16575, partial [Kofleriaceae bacterium]|nr:hypothetical protein [Kofleriaceae bacterium]
GELARRLLDHHGLLEPLLTPATRAALDEYFGRHRAQAIEHGRPAVNHDESYLRWGETLRVAERAAAGGALPGFDGKRHDT